MRPGILLVAALAACSAQPAPVPVAPTESVPLVAPSESAGSVESTAFKDIPPPRVALVLGGGGARGFAHVGVLRVLEKEKIKVDLVVGTSVGSLIGALYAAEPNTFELEWKSFQLDKEDLFDFSFFAAKTGPVKGEAVQQFLRANIKERRIEDFAIPFIAVATDLNTGEMVLFREGDVIQAVRASVSIPGVFTPARVGTRTLVDGGVVANVAVDVARDAGADIVIVSNITSNVVDHEVEDVVSIILQSVNIMMSKMAAHELQNADVVITPKIGDVGTLDFTQKKRCMEEGIAATEAQVAAIKNAVVAYYRERGGVPPIATAD